MTNALDGLTRREQRAVKRAARAINAFETWRREHADEHDPAKDGRQAAYAGETCEAVLEAVALDERHWARLATLASELATGRTEPPRGR